MGLRSDVIAHTAEKQVKLVDSLEDERAFVQHHAFGMRGHRRISHLAPGRNAGSYETLEELGGPEDRDMGDFKNQGYAFLHFSRRPARKSPSC
ncbi:MAG: hypothetical protein NTX73_05920 [Rhodobacterales bacterium]|nr:hypothetical protein [Rhodobacterales bacterium]